MDFESWLLAKVSANSAKKYCAAINGVISDWVIAAGLSAKPLNQIKTPEHLLALMPKICGLKIFIERNLKGKGMYYAALNQYAAYLAEHYQPSTDEDLFNVLAQPITLTEKQTLISARVGQGAFRQSLFKLWQGCAVTGYAEPSLLVASHIKPWRACNNPERLDPYNGLLLLPNLDRAFDYGLISFDDLGAILLSPAFTEPERLGIHRTMKVRLKPQHLPYLHFHQEQVFQGA